MHRREPFSELAPISEETTQEYIRRFPLPEQAEFYAARARARNMTREEFLQSLVDAGIYNPDGTLRPEYGG